MLISNREDYEKVRHYLTEHKGFRTTRNNSFVILSPSGIEIDILPFGEVEIDEVTPFSATGFSNIRETGFMEVYKAGTEDMKLNTGHTFKIATLPGIVLLKLVAYDDRPELRSKDPRDITNIIFHYFDLQAEMIYENHADLFTHEDGNLVDISANVIGREIRRMVADNRSLHQRLINMISTHIELNSKSTFIRNMVSESKGTFDEMTILLKSLLEGIVGCADETWNAEN